MEAPLSRDAVIIAHLVKQPNEAGRLAPRTAPAPDDPARRVERLHQIAFKVLVENLGRAAGKELLQQFSHLRVKTPHVVLELFERGDLSRICAKRIRRDPVHPWLKRAH